MGDPASSWRNSGTFCLISLLIVGAFIRYWAIPYRYDFRDYDEPHYITCGLQVFEGMAPVYHYAPAGPESWFGWLHAGVLSARYMVFPTAEERQVPAVIRPYTAANHALFDLYRDKSAMRIEYIVLSMIISLFAVIAGFRLGWIWSGMAGATLLGGLMAFMPLLIEFSAISKSYSMAWSFSIISIYFAASDRRPRNWAFSAIFLGLAIGSRVEMLGVFPFPIVLLWARRANPVHFMRAVLRYIGVVAIAALLVAPWLLTNLMGNLRAIASIRFGPTARGVHVWIETARELGWNQGLLVIILMLFGGVGLGLFAFRTPASDPETAQSRAECKSWKWMLFAYGFFMLASIFRGTGYGLRHHGPAVIALLAVSPLAVGPFARRWPRATWIMIGAALLLPLVQCLRSTSAFLNGSVHADVTAWVETHVPRGTNVYVSTTFHDPLPTPESADVIWNEVASPAAPERKFKSALERFGVGNIPMPYALSEQNMITERASERGWYILGSRSEIAGPRFHVHPFNESAVFGLYDPVPTFNKTGGVLIWRFPGAPPGLANAVQIWNGGKGTDVVVYATPDVAAHVKQDR